jgi:NAD(P)-dependent dehydrogenase (short-subunit alcohol dehydrogenase family)
MSKELMIFGAGGALGKGVTEVLLKKDYDKIYLLDFKLPEADYPPEVTTIIYDDLSNEENLIEVFKQITPESDKTLFLFSTVGGYFGGKMLWEMETEEWDKMFNMNLKTSFLIAKHFSLKVKESKAGSIFFTAAYTALHPESGKAAYGASKRGLISLVETLAIEGESIDLTVNAAAPFIIDTPANREWGSKSEAENWIKPSEIGEIVHNVFTHFHCISGNVIKLKTRLNLNRV